MLAFLAAFLIILSGARAQTNSEYSFRQQSVADGQSYNGNCDPVPVFSMDCLAANGYGQWTLSSQCGQAYGRHHRPISKVAAIHDGPIIAFAEYAIAHRKGNDGTLSVDSNSYTNCDSLRFKIWNYQGAHNWQALYDTTMKFIDSCYNDPWAPAMFQEISAAEQSLEPNDTGLWLQYQLWLESVLYLNTTNPDYFCQCVENMVVGNPSDDTSELLAWKGMNKGLAVLRWLIQNTTCDTPRLLNMFYGARASQYSDWLNDTTVPLDTTIPSLASLGLGLDTLLAKHLLYEQVSESAPPEVITNAFASPNPVNTGTEISFTMSKEAYVKIQLYDVLGHSLSGAGFEGLFQPGNKEVPISLQGLPSGTYYARIVTAYGEVQTVKLVKE